MKIEIRLASIHDIPEIVSILQASLGESKLPKSAEIWKYKHLDNPFGESFVLLAVKGPKIIGVRAFMKWEWVQNQNTFIALRAVDTGIHPEFQRKGVFKALNAEALKLAEDKNFNFIFNTPNKKSIVGNLKMGWQKIGRIGIKVLPGNILGGRKDFRPLVKDRSILISESLLKNFNLKLNKTSKMYTPKSKTYLKWRYEENPLQKYEIFCDQDFYIAAYVKEHKYYRELRIAEHIYIDKIGLNKIHSAISNLNKLYGTEVICFSRDMELNSIRLNLDIGPILLGRKLDFPENHWGMVMDQNNWNYSLGDLELF